MPPLAVGDAVQTPLGKGVVRQVRKNGTVSVDVSGRNVLFEGRTVKPIDRPTSSRKTRRSTPPAPGPVFEDRQDRGGGAAEVDLHGLVVVDALERVEEAINDAILAGHARLRIIHGRSGGRIRAALHRQLRLLPAIRGFRVDPANEGVTVVEF